jgi:hypothetical protein
VNSDILLSEYTGLTDVVTPDRERLLLRLEQYSLVEKIVTGDGACQFRSLSDQLYRTPLYHDVVRNKVLEQLKSHPELYSMYVPAEYGKYCTEMSKPTTWGDHVTLKAAADTYGLQIKVLTSFVDTALIKIEPKQTQSQRVLWLSFWAEVHYNSIYPKLEDAQVSSSASTNAAAATSALCDDVRMKTVSGSKEGAGGGHRSIQTHSFTRKLGSRLANVFK